MGLCPDMPISNHTSILDSRKGKVDVVVFGTDTGFVSKMTDDDVKQAIAISQLQKKAIAAAEAGDRKKAIKLFESIVTKAPFDSISMMSRSSARPARRRHKGCSVP